jgi:hypothetical protein
LNTPGGAAVLGARYGGKETWHGFTHNQELDETNVGVAVDTAVTSMREWSSGNTCQGGRSRRPSDNVYMKIAPLMVVTTVLAMSFFANSAYFLSIERTSV